MAKSRGGTQHLPARDAVPGNTQWDPTGTTQLHMDSTRPRQHVPDIFSEVTPQHQGIGSHGVNPLGNDAEAHQSFDCILTTHRHAISK